MSIFKKVSKSELSDAALAEHEPALRRAIRRGIVVEVWGLPRERWGDFIAGIPAPLGIGSVRLADGSTVRGFMCEGFAVQDPEAVEITRLGDWRRFIRERVARKKRK